MKIRIISSIVGLILLAAVIFLGKLAITVAIFLLAVMGVYEFYKSASKAGYKPVSIIGYISCFSILFIGFNGNLKNMNFNLEQSLSYFSLGLYAALVLLFAMIIFLHEKYNLLDISITLFGIIYVVFLFSFVVLTRNMENGAMYFWLILIGAWATDTAAYFTGYIWGKRKILPAISPKKTLEGSIGGILGCIIVTTIYGFFMNYYFLKNSIADIAPYHFIILGTINGVISQVGDWGASAIKRFVKTKDYGWIMPGHGGVLDRFDSILFIAPVVYFYIDLIILR